MTDQPLADEILKHTLQILRLSAGQADEAEAILVELTRELKLLLSSADLTDAGKRDIAKLINEAEEAIRVGYLRAGAVSDTHSLAVIVAEHTQRVLEEAIPVEIKLPSAVALQQLGEDVLIDGAPSSAWWSKQADDLKFKFAAQVRQGIANNETQEQIVTRIVGKRGEPGIMDRPRRDAWALVHSSVLSAANQARLATFKKNEHLFKGVRWLSTLDSHTCLQCAALDGAQWNLDGEKLKGTTIRFQAPPAHFGCRCVLSGIPKTFRDIGLDIPEPTDPGSRASSDGPVEGNITFDAWLKRQSPEFIANTLGTRRAELFTKGKLTLRDLISGTGRALTLDELRQH